MALDSLTSEDIALIAGCLGRAADGPFFDDSEFQTLFGVEREAVRAVAAKWPHVDWPDEDVELAVINSLNNLLAYPHGRSDSEIGYSSTEIVAVLRKLRPSATSYFQAML